MNIQGLAELQAALESMSNKVANSGVRKALKAGAAPVQTGMVSLAPKDTGFMSEHFNTRIKMEKEGRAGTAFIGPQGKVDYPAYVSGAYNIVRNVKGKAKKVGKIAVATIVRFFEFGTAKMSKKPFMTQSFEVNKGRALDNIIESLNTTVQDAASASPKGPTT
jgi:HK97 gp10 family phage protein